MSGPGPAGHPEATAAPSAGSVVLVAFSDHTLRGVSRSALNAGRMWRALGHPVHFLPFQAVHPDRLPRFEQVARVLG